MADLKERNEQPIAMKVRLRATNNVDQPVSANYTRVSVAGGVAYLDFAFIEPALLAGIAQAAQNGGAAVKNLEGKLTSRVALPLDGVIQLHQQLQQVLMSLSRRKGDKQ